MTLTNTTLLITATTTALMAGLFFAWSCSVTIGIARLPDAEYIAAMQAMNRAIQNPVFLLCFLGTGVLLPLSTYLHYHQPLSVRFWLLLAATALYLIGVLGVTFVGNIPLNEALDKFQLQSASVQEIATQRVKFEEPWNSLTTVRTVTSILAIVLVIMACMSPTDIENFPKPIK